MTTDTRSEIDGALRRWEQCFNSGDTAGLADLYTEDATLMPPDSEVIRGRKGVQEFWQAARDSGVQKIMLHIGDVEVHGDLLIEVSHATITVNNADVPAKYVVIWKREAGGWMLHVDMWSGTKAA